MPSLIAGCYVSFVGIELGLFPGKEGGVEGKEEEEGVEEEGGGGGGGGVGRRWRSGRSGEGT